MSLTQVTPDVISTNTISGLISSGFTSMNVATMGTQTIEFGSSNTLVFRANTSTERMRITTAGNIGIGTTNPNAKLVVTQATTGSTAAIVNGVAGRLTFDFNGGGYSYYDSTSHVFRTFAGVTRSQYDFSSNNTVHTLSAGTGGYSAQYLNSTGTAYLVYQTNSTETGRVAVDSSSTMLFGTGSSGTERMRITSGGDVFVGGGSGSVLGYEKFAAYGSGGFKTTGSQALGLWNTANPGLLVFYTEAGGTNAGSISAVGSALSIAGGSNLNLTATGASVMTFNTNSSERMRIMSDGCLNIGKTDNPYGKLDIGGQANGVAANVARFGNIVGQNNGPLISVDASNNWLFNNNSGSIRVGSTIAVGGATALYGVGGITFPATQSASSDANTLDDYEEGTWTPNFVGSSSSGTITSNASAGRYIKIGGLVWLHCQLHFNCTTAGSGSFSITGLPFTATSINGHGQALALGPLYNWNVDNSAYQIGARVNDGSTSIFFWNNFDNAGDSQLSWPFAGGGTTVFGSITGCYSTGI